MVSSSHEAMHRIFQDHPTLFSRVSETLGIPFPAPTAISELPNDVTETKPVDRRIGTLLRIVHTGRRWYFVARDVGRGEWRTFGRGGAGQVSAGSWHAPARAGVGLSVREALVRRTRELPAGNGEATS